MLPWINATALDQRRAFIAAYLASDDSIADLARRFRVSRKTAHPERNGRLERFHRTLKEAAMNPPAPTLADQQRAFDAFRRVSDEERPHEALGQRPPASRYAPSPRPYPGQGREPRIPGGRRGSARSEQRGDQVGGRARVRQRGADRRACWACPVRRPALDGPVRPLGDWAVGRLRPAYNQDSRQGVTHVSGLALPMSSVGQALARRMDSCLRRNDGTLPAPTAVPSPAAFAASSPHL